MFLADLYRELNRSKEMEAKLEAEKLLQCVVLLLNLHF